MTKFNGNNLNVPVFIKEYANYIIVAALMLFGAFLFRNTNPATPVGFAFLYILLIVAQLIYLVKAAVSNTMKFGTVRAGGDTLKFYIFGALPVYLIIFALVIFDFFTNSRIASNLISMAVLLIYVIPFRIKRRVNRAQGAALHTPNVSDEYGQAVAPPIIDEYDEYADVKRPVNQIEGIK